MKLKQSKWIILAFAVIALLWLLTPTHSTFAKGSQRGNKMVRNDGAVVSIQNFARHILPNTKPTVNTRKNIKVPAKNLQPIQMGGMESVSGAESVIGEDGRTQVLDTTAYPNSAIVYLEINFPLGAGSCSGWMIGPHTIATAGHCVYLADLGGWATSITAYPGRNGLLAPFGSYDAEHWYAKKKWINREKPKFDFAAINIGTDIATTVGTFGFAYNADDTFFQERSITVRGYPGDKPEATLWTMDGAIAQVNPTRFFYEIDTAGGQSGSPMYGNWGSECDPCGFAIHTYGVGGTWTLNSATRITSSVFNFLNTAITQ